MGPKIVLVSPPFSYGKVNILAPKSPRLGLAYLAAFVREKGYKNLSIIDSTAMEYNETETADAILKEKPYLVGFTATTTEYPAVLRIAEEVKKRKPFVLSVIGGPHITIMPETINAAAFDYAVIGEGEQTFLELLDFLTNGNKDARRIKGLAFFSSGQVCLSEPRGFLPDLDELPMPAHELLPIARYRPPAMSDRGRPFTCMITSRGCPIQCSFCSSSRIFGRRLRCRSVEKMMQEVDYLQERFNISHIYFQDDEFMSSKWRLLDFCNHMKRRKRNIVWECLGRVSDADKEVVEAMAQAGCIGILYGAEFGYEEGLKLVKKGITLEMTREAIRLTRAAGISARASFMMGFPWEDERKIKKTVDFALDIKADIVALQIVIPYPGTDIYEDMAKENLLVSSDWSRYIQHSVVGTRPVVRTRYISSDGLKRLNNNAFRRMLTTPSYVFRVLSQIKNMRQLYRIIIGGAVIFFMSMKDLLLFIKRRPREDDEATQAALCGVSDK